MFPIRCLTCNKPIIKTVEFLECSKNNNEVQLFLDKHNIKRYCCRRIYISYVEVKPLPIIKNN